MIDGSEMFNFLDRIESVPFQAQVFTSLMRHYYWRTHHKSCKSNRITDILSEFLQPELKIMQETKVYFLDKQQMGDYNKKKLKVN